MSAIAVQVQNLQSVPYTPTGNVSQGDVVIVNGLIGVAQRDIAANVQGNVIIGQNYVWSVPKATTGGSGAALAFGTEAYWDPVNLIASPNPSVGPLLGIAVSNSLTDAMTNLEVLFRPVAGVPTAGVQIKTTALSNATLTKDLITGAGNVSLTTTADGSNALTTRTATQMFADTPGAQVGQGYRLRITNTGNNTVTLTAGSGVTLTGTMTIATNTTRDFVVTFNSATALTIQTDGVGTIS